MRLLKITLLAVTIGMAATAFGQEESDIFPRHEVSVGYGFIPSTSLGYSANQNFPATREYVGSITACYTYKFNKVIGMGATLAFDNHSYQMLDKNADNATVCDVRQNIGTALVHLKVNWVRTKVVTMYSKIGIGISFYSNNVNVVDSVNYIVNTDNMPKTCSTGYSLIPVGIELGSKQYAAFMQLGCGAEGIFSLGFRCGINKTYKQ